MGVARATPRAQLFSGRGRMEGLEGGNSKNTEIRENIDNSNLTLFRFVLNRDSVMARPGTFPAVR